MDNFVNNARTLPRALGALAATALLLVGPGQARGGAVEGSPADAPPARDQRSMTVCIGLSHYPGRRLLAVEEEAMAACKAVRAPNWVMPRLYLGPEETSRQGLANALTEIGSVGQTERVDNVVVYLSGAWVTVEGMNYLIPTDIDVSQPSFEQAARTGSAPPREALAATLISQREIEDALSKTGAKVVVLLLAPQPRKGLGVGTFGQDADWASLQQQAWSDLPEPVRHRPVHLLMPWHRVEPSYK